MSVEVAVKYMYVHIVLLLLFILELSKNTFFEVLLETCGRFIRVFVSLSLSVFHLDWKGGWNLIHYLPKYIKNLRNNHHLTYFNCASFKTTYKKTKFHLWQFMTIYTFDQKKISSSTSKNTTKIKISKKVLISTKFVVVVIKWE